MTQTWLTQEAADRLRAELTQLEGPGRKDVTAKIELVTAVPTRSEAVNADVSSCRAA